MCARQVVQILLVPFENRLRDAITQVASRIHNKGSRALTFSTFEVQVDS